MRLSPHDVRTGLTGNVPDDMLRAYLAAVRGDPNWQVTDVAGVSLHTLSLLYHPTGDRLDIVLLHVGQSWRARVQPGGVAA